jgi:hypothetical protein
MKFYILKADLLAKMTPSLRQLPISTKKFRGKLEAVMGFYFAEFRVSFLEAECCINCWACRAFNL